MLKISLMSIAMLNIFDTQLQMLLNKKVSMEIVYTLLVRTWIVISCASIYHGSLMLWTKNYMFHRLLVPLLFLVFHCCVGCELYIRPNYHLTRNFFMRRLHQHIKNAYVPLWSVRID